MILHKMVNKKFMWIMILHSMNLLLTHSTANLVGQWITGKIELLLLKNSKHYWYF